MEIVAGFLHHPAPRCSSTVDTAGEALGTLGKAFWQLKPSLARLLVARFRDAVVLDAVEKATGALFAVSPRVPLDQI